jgi:hypothetical protein
MTEENYILDVPLPLSQDFQALKAQGLAYIQAHSDYHWTNLNASDPGVTILDQVCYALTELGYCNDFPVKDILAKKDGEIHITDQFYLPADILTTSPVTVIDYKKYLIDGVTDVNNVVLLRSKKNTSPVYQTFLLIDPSVQTSSSKAYVCAAAFVYLNKARNLCELFAMPAELFPASYSLSGTIEIESTDQLDNILQLINTAISNYIFAPVVPNSYQQLTDDNNMTDIIFEGPQLKSGWISTSMLGKKKDKLTIYEAIQLISAVPGVVSIGELYFSGSGKESISCHTDELLVINATTSYESGSLVFVCNGSSLTGAKYIVPEVTAPAGPDFESNILYGAGIDIRHDLPKAEYRNINSYYSVQNTFPAIYSVGPGATDDSATQTQIAQSRQLKGYLTLFDQVLANQFSQLANIDQLFSFRNAMTATPSDTQWYYAVKDQQQKKNPFYPVPYLRFSPTYYFQSLYHVPGIKPLLAGNETFNFSVKPGGPTEKKEWHRFRLDPYNAYVRGLMNIMEEEASSLHRRNEMLDHLLARHGESYVLINAYIDGSFYTKERIKDKVIFKSLYLQNLGKLSYNRYKAYDYLQADKFVKKHKEPEHKENGVTEEIFNEFKNEIFDKEISEGLSPDEENYLKTLINEDDASSQRRLLKWILEGNMIDSVFDSGKVNELEKLSDNDFRNYSGIELKLGLLFGIKVLFRDFIISKNKDHSVSEKLQALWLISKRKGFLMVEMILLKQCLEFELIITANNNTAWRTEIPLSYNDASALVQFLSDPSSASNVIFTANSCQVNMNDTIYQLSLLNRFVGMGSPIAPTEFSFTMNVRKTTIDINEVDALTNGPLFIFPGYIHTFRSYEFNTRAEFFLNNELPVNMPVTISGNLFNADADQMEKLIHSFRKWHDSLVYDSLDNYTLLNSAVPAAELLSEIILLSQQKSSSGT